MSKQLFSILGVGLLIAFGVLYLSSGPAPVDDGAVAETRVENGIQYVTVVAKGGYSPRLSYVEAGLPTKLVLKTEGTYDCSASTRIPRLGYQKILPATAEDIVDLGILNSGDTIQGLCGMGMYSFQINAR